MTKEEFDTKWEAISGTLWALANAWCTNYPRKEFDPDETLDERYNRRQSRWVALNNYHTQVRELCDKHGLSIADYAFNHLNDAEEPAEIRDWWKKSAELESVETDDGIESVEVSPMPMVVINAPAWFKREDFLAWLNAPRTATWHISGEAADEYSDVWFTFCDGDGSDSPCGGDQDGKVPHIPEDIWGIIEYEVIKRLGTDNECVVRITNLD